MSHLLTRFSNSIYHNKKNTKQDTRTNDINWVRHLEVCKNNMANEQQYKEAKR